MQERVETGDDASIEAVQLRTFGLFEFCVRPERFKQTGGQRSVNAFEKFQEEYANAIAFGAQSIAVRRRDLIDQALGSAF